MESGETVKSGRMRPSTGVPVGLQTVGAPRRGRQGAFTLIELMLVVSVMLIAFLGLSQSLVASMALTRVNRESALATDGLRQMVEVLQGVERFDEVFSMYNADPGDDPGTGPAPGSGFAVAGLQPVEGDADGLVGEIVFPTVDLGGSLALWEDVDMPELGMPRDLNGDGDVDMLNHAGDYRLLPVLVRLRWMGASGERTAEVRTLLADR